MPAPTLLTTIKCLELLLALSGFWLLWKRSQAAKAPASAVPPLPGSAGADAPPPSLLRPWAASVTDLGMLLWVVFCGGLFAQIVGMGLLSWYDAGPTLTQLLVGAMFQLGMLLAVVGFTRFNAAGRQYDFPRAGFLREGALTFVCALGPVFAIGFVWNYLLKVLGIPANDQDLVNLFRNADNLSTLSFLIGLAIIIAPLTEELIFRAGIFRFLSSHTTRVKAVLFSSLLFGVIHLNLASFPQLTVLGIFFALSYRRTGNVAVPMFAHALFNLNTILLILAGIDN